MTRATSVQVSTRWRNGASRGMPCLVITFNEGFTREEYTEALKQILADVEAGELVRQEIDH